MSMDPKSLRSRYNAEYFSRYDVKTTLGTTAATMREYSASSAESTCTSFGSMRGPSRWTTG